jgi:demethylmenaquinone methyltransferase/2-methoxy-6-polyprenyl-1,4-benzoquinol methylase
MSSKTPEAYGYLSESIEAWHSQEYLAALVAEAGWQNVEVRNLSFGVVALHIAKKKSAN